MSEELKVKRTTALRRFKLYPSYKDSGVEWLGKTPAHWEVKRLKNCVHSLESGGTPESDNFEYWTDDESGVPWVAISDMTRSFRVRDTAKRLTKRGLHSKRLPVLPAGTLLYSMYASLGKVALLEIDAVVNQAILGLITRADLASRDYLRWWLEFMQGHVQMLSSSNTQDNLNADKVRKMPVFVPRPDEQRNVAAFLDRETARIDSLVAKKRRHIELLHEKIDLLIERVVSGDRISKDVRLGYYVDLLPGYAFDSSGFSHDRADIRLLRGVNVSTGIIRWDDAVFWPRSDVAKFFRYELQKGDLVFGMDRPWIGTGIRVAEISESDTPSLLLQRVARLRARPGLSQSYLRVLLSSPQFRAYFEPILTGISVPHVSPNQILSFRVRLPAVHVQESKARELWEATSTMSAMCEDLESSVDHLKELRTALISAAVTGKIDVREGVV